MKRSANGIIFDPVTLPPTATVAKAREMMNQANISGVPITASTTNKKLLGIITRRDLRFLESSDTPISEIMTRQNLVTAQGTVTLAEAEKILMANKVRSSPTSTVETTVLVESLYNRDIIRKCISHIDVIIAWVKRQSRRTISDINWFQTTLLVELSITETSSDTGLVT